MTTNRMQVIQNVAISLARGPSDAKPNLPIVKAMAPKAPMGAKLIRMLTTPKTA